MRNSCPQSLATRSSARPSSATYGQRPVPVRPQHRPRLPPAAPPPCWAPGWPYGLSAPHEISASRGATRAYELRVLVGRAVVGDLEHVHSARRPAAGDRNSACWAGGSRSPSSSSRSPAGADEQGDAGVVRVRPGRAPGSAAATAPARSSGPTLRCSPATARITGMCRAAASLRTNSRLRPRAPRSPSSRSPPPRGRAAPRAARPRGRRGSG